MSDATPSTELKEAQIKDQKVLGERRTGYERFFSDAFLLSRGKLTFEQLVSAISRNLLSTSAQLFVFGGGLGLVWVLSHLEPQGDLSLYLLPITLLAMPIAVIAPNDTWIERAVNALFLAPFIGGFAWSCAWYFLHPEWGYHARWLALEGFGVITLIYFCLKRSLNIPRGPQHSLIRSLWATGIVICWGALGFLGYYIGAQTAPEYGTSNMMSGGSFILFLAILIIRVFWLDSIRARRANRAEFTPPQDHIILFEWLVPRSFNFALTLVMLLVAQSMMFSTIYRASRHKTSQGSVSAPSPHTRSVDRSLSSPSHLPELQVTSSPDQPHTALSSPHSATKETWSPETPVTTPMSSRREQSLEILSSVERRGDRFNELLKRVAAQDAEIKPDVNLSAWIFFSFKPYVFPKDDGGREVSAPIWFKYLGRTLIGLIIAILLTKQLNIWKQIMGYYWVLLGASRAERQYGPSEERSRQQTEMIANLAGIFDHYSIMWRWLLYYAVTAPTLSLKWRVILDPSSAYYMGLARAHDWVIVRWDAAVAFAAAMILIVMTPFAYFDPHAWDALFHAAMPSVVCAIGLFILRVVIGLKPPSSYQRWIWWILIGHIVIALLNFFLALNLGTHESFWSGLLWHAEVYTIVAYPAVYLLGGDRYGRVETLARRRYVRVDDCDVEVRRKLLIAFCDTEHRHWLVSRLVHHIHPVRSSRLQFWLVTPTLLLRSLSALRSGAQLTFGVLKLCFGSYLSALYTWLGVIMTGWILTLLGHLFTYHQMLPYDALTMHILDLIAVSAPTLAALCLLWLPTRVSALRGRAHQRWLAVIGVTASVFGGLTLWHETPHLFSAQTELLDARRYDLWLSWLMVPTIPLIILIAPLLSRLARWSGQSRTVNGLQGLDQRVEESIQRLQDRLISSVYQKALRGRVFERRFQDALILSVARVVETSFERIKGGEWFVEERHARARVVSELFSKAQSGRPRHAQLLDELCGVLELSFDTLGSMLHDLCLTDLLKIEPSSGEVHSDFEDLDELKLMATQSQSAPKVSVVVEALRRIALFPLPHRASLDEVEERPAVENLKACHREVVALVGALVTSKREDPSVSEEERLHLTHLWCQLEGQHEDLNQWPGSLSPALGYFKKLLTSRMTPLSSKQSQEDTSQDDTCEDALSIDETRLLLSATLQHPRGAELISQVVAHPSVSEHLEARSTLIDHLALLVLPTPIALLYQDLLEVIYEASVAQEWWESCRTRRQELAEGAEITSDELNELNEHRRALKSSSSLLRDVGPSASSASSADHQLKRDQSLRVWKSLTNARELVSAQLSHLQSPPQVELIKLELEAQQAFNRAHQRRYHALYRLYFGSCAYLFAALKNEGVIPALDQLSWLNASSVQRSLEVLSSLNLSGRSHELRDLILRTIQPDEALIIEEICRDQRSWSEAHEVGHDLIERLLEVANDLKLPYFSWSPSEPSSGAAHMTRDDLIEEDGELYPDPLPSSSTSEEEEAPIERLLLRGVRPRFLRLRGDDDLPDLTSESLACPPTVHSERRLGRCYALKRGMQLIGGERELPLDYYSALWLLELLFALANSDGVFQVKRISEVSARIDKLQALLNRVGALLKPFASEEQEVIEHVFNMVLQRLRMLRVNIESSEAIGKQGAVDFGSALERVEVYLDGIEARRVQELEVLMGLHLTPSLSFSFLLNSSRIDDIELNSYLHFQSSSLMSFYESEI